MRDLIYRKNKKGEYFLMAEISRKLRGYDKGEYGKVICLRIFHPKSNPVDDTDGDIFIFQKKDRNYYLIPNMCFASEEVSFFLINVYHQLLLKGDKVTIGEFIEKVYKDYFYFNGKPN